MPNVNIFFSYSRKDYNSVAPLFIKFRTLLKTVSHNGKRYTIRYWNDENIVPGKEWDDTIKWELKSSDVVIFFVTKNFLSTDSWYIHQNEIPIALERQKDVGIHLFSVLIEDCAYKESKIGHLQFIANRKGYLTPFTEWKDKKAFFEYVKFALKLSIKNSLAGFPDPLTFNPDLSAADRNKYIQYFAPPEVVRLSKRLRRRSKPKKKKKTSFFRKIKKQFLKVFKIW